MSGARGIDHLVLPVGDLDAAAGHYEAMGFMVGARNRQPWGTENRLVQFPGSFLELIALGEGEVAPQVGRFAVARRGKALLRRLTPIHNAPPPGRPKLH